MNPSIELMGQITHFMKYAKFMEADKRRETWEENVIRTREMHIKKYPFLREEIKFVFNEYVLPKLVLPSMRSMQFAGLPIELNESRIYNCSYLPIEHWKAFREVMFLLIGGSGVGYSVQNRHVEKLPSIRKPTRSKKYLIADDMIGWSNAVEVLTKAYLDGGAMPIFDYRAVRKKGTPLKTSGGKAPGPEPLKRTLTNLQAIFEAKDNGQRLSPLECHDMCCFIADAVLAGGIREAAMISLFSLEDHEMIKCKSNFNAKLIDEQQVKEDLWQVVVEVNGWMPPSTHTVYLDKKHYEMLKEKKKLPWWYFQPQRARSNNSVVFIRNHHTELNFRGLWKQIVESEAGEPGIFFTNDPNWGTNPCAEIGLKPYQFCNLCEINMATVTDQKDFEERAKAAAFIGTLQAGFTDFHYLRDIWKETTERDSLLGVSMTGIASVDLTKFDLAKGAEMVKDENIRLAKLMDIKPAARTTCVKPSGTTSLILGTSSGIHAWYARYYMRRLRLVKTEPLYAYLSSIIPNLIEDSKSDPQNTAYVCIPMKAPDSATTVDKETTFDFLNRVKKVSDEWVKPGHAIGENSHNVSATVYVKHDEWDAVGKWMWENRESFNGLAVLPMDGGTYTQAPHEEITESKYNELLGHLQKVDLTQVMEGQDYTTRATELACNGNVCERAM